VTPNDAFADLVRRRARSLNRYAHWESTHPAVLIPAAAVEAIGALYDLLPMAARKRAVDASGVISLHRALTRASR
jgi:hypothetical protein